MFSVYALLAGTLIALQASVNAQLGVLLKSPVIATSVAFLLSAVISFVVIVLTSQSLPPVKTIASIPAYFWMGGVVSALGVGLCYYLIPLMGVGSMMSYALTGQLITAMVIAHFGLFGSAEIPVTSTKLLGALAMMIGIALINR
ncbi:MAG: DMT family transporter [Paraglaciecola sp.]|uniref:DMT family transporter n=1 Tax=Paraglaciecola sp. TaxID=1920173 RepID=UPI003299E7EE